MRHGPLFLVVGGLVALVAVLSSVVSQAAQPRFPDGSFVAAQDGGPWLILNNRRQPLVFIPDTSGVLSTLPEGQAIISAHELRGAVRMGPDTPFPDGSFVTGQDGAPYLVLNGLRRLLVFIPDTSAVLGELPDGRAIASAFDIFIPTGSDCLFPPPPPAIRTPLSERPTGGPSAALESPWNCQPDLPAAEELFAYGTYSGLEGKTLWVLVQVLQPGGAARRYYPQSLSTVRDGERPPAGCKRPDEIVPTDSVDGHFSTPVFFGRKGFQEVFAVVVVAADEAASQRFRTYLADGCRSNTFPGIAPDAMPPVTELDVVLVRTRG